MSEPLRTVNVGLIGLGTVGGGVARLIKSHHDEYLAAYGIDLKLTRACALAWEQAEAAGIEREAFTSDWHDVVTDPAVDIVVELIGGEHPATEIFTTAFEHGKHVVSANKALLGRHVETLAEKARACGVQIKCEASCGGGIPIVSTLEHDLVGNKILTIAGRGRPVRRRRRLRCRQQDGNPRLHRLWHPRDHRQCLPAGHPYHRRRGHRPGPRARLHH